MLEHEQKNVWKMIGDADSPGTYQKKLESVRSVLWGYVQYLIFPKLNRERWKYQKRF